MVGYEVNITILGLAGITTGDSASSQFGLNNEYGKKETRGRSRPLDEEVKSQTKVIAGFLRDGDDVFTTTGFSGEVSHDPSGSVIVQSTAKDEDGKEVVNQNVFTDLIGLQRFTALWEKDKSDVTTGLGPSVAFDVEDNEEISIKFLVAFANIKDNATSHAAHPIGTCMFDVNTSSEEEYQLVDIPIKYIGKNNNFPPFKTHSLKAPELRPGKERRSRSRSLSRLFSSRRVRSKSMPVRAKSEQIDTKKSATKISGDKNNSNDSLNTTLEHLKNITLEQGMVCILVGLKKKEFNFEVTLEEMIETISGGNNDKQLDITSPLASCSLFAHGASCGALNNECNNGSFHSDEDDQSSDDDECASMIFDGEHTVECHQESVDHYSDKSAEDATIKLSKTKKPQKKRSWFRRFNSIPETTEDKKVMKQRRSSFVPMLRMESKKLLRSLSARKGSGRKEDDRGVASVEEDSIERIIKVNGNGNDNSPQRSTSTQSTSDITSKSHQEHGALSENTAPSEFPVDDIARNDSSFISDDEPIIPFGCLSSNDKTPKVAQEASAGGRLTSSYDKSSAFSSSGSEENESFLSRSHTEENEYSPSQSEYTEGYSEDLTTLSDVLYKADPVFFSTPKIDRPRAQTVQDSSSIKSGQKKKSRSGPDMDAIATPDPANWPLLLSDEVSELSFRDRL